MNKCEYPGCKKAAQETFALVPFVNGTAMLSRKKPSCITETLAQNTKSIGLCIARLLG
ncbi:hypothetical protein P7H17_24000 [Paenibacillus larvae]|nr:hypothetical protein [Paenibacillus larvae]MDT2288496.1 hypothetical protein [Paenibacillus larvae]